MTKRPNVTPTLKVLTQGDFEPPPLATVGDQHEDEIHLAAGRAIHRWEVVEHALGLLFGALVGDVKGRLSLKPYGALTGFDVRRQLIMQVAEATFDNRPNKQLHDKIKTVVDGIANNAALRRNEIVHGLVVGKERSDRVHWFLEPSYHSTRARRPNREPQYRYTSKEIEQLARKFRLLDGMLHRLTKEVSAWRWKREQ